MHWSTWASENKGPVLRVDWWPRRQLAKRRQVYKPVGVQDGAAAARLIDDDCRSGDGAFGLKDRIP